MKSKERIIISAGDNKSHLIAIAGELYRKNIYEIYFLSSFYPKYKLRKLLKIISPFIKSISRLIDRTENIDEEKVFSILISEAISKIAAIFTNKKNQNLKNNIQNIGMKVYGNYSINILRKVQPKIYHFRCCYGLSSLNYANKKNIITICDHTICHPRFLWTQMFSENLTKDPFKLNKLNDNEAKFMNNFYKSMEYDLEKSNFILVNSELVKKSCIFYGINPHKIKVIYNGCDSKFLFYNPNFEEIRKERNKLLFVGSWIPRKGVIELCKALIELDEEITLSVVGATLRDINKITPFIFKSKIKLNIYGYINREKLSEIYSSHQIFLFPSLAEGSARVIFEALASGCFVITTPFSGSIVKNNINGLLVNAGDIKQLKNAIRNALDMSNNYINKIMFNNFRLVRTEYTPQKYIQKLNNFYQLLLSS